MKRTLVLVLFLTALLGISSVWADTLNVGSGQIYTTIQSAIVAAQPTGDIINVYPGTYNESLNVTKNVTIQGVDAGGSPIISRDNVVAEIAANADNSAQATIFITADNVVVKGLEVTVWDENYNFRTIMVNSNNVTVQHCVLNVLDMLTGIYVYDANYDPVTETSHIVAYNFSDNLIEVGGTYASGFRFSSGAGKSGLLADKLITNNIINDGSYGLEFVGPDFNAWDVYPVGPAIITGNSFTGQDKGAFSAWSGNDLGNGYGYFDIDSILANNTFDRAVVVKTPTGDVRSWDFAGDNPSYDIIGIYSGIQRYPINRVAQPGDVIQVAPGTYTETPSPATGLGSIQTCIDVTKGVTISSTGGSGSTFIDAAGAYIGFNIPANVGTVTIEGFTIDNFTHIGIVQSRNAYAGTISIIKNNVINATGGFMQNGIQLSGSGSQVIGNTIYGATYDAENPDYGSSGISIVCSSSVDNVLIKDNTITDTNMGIAVQREGFLFSNVTVNGNTVSDCQNAGIQVGSWPDVEPLSGITLTNNNIHDNPYGMVIWHCTVTELTITGNTFADNDIHFENQQVDPVNIPAIISDNIFNSYYFVLDQIIYGKAELNVDVPDEVIPDNFEQTYSVVASYVENLRDFTVTVKIPVADFDTLPDNFVLGSDFDTMMPILTAHTATEWVFEVSGAILGGVTGVSGEDIVLFTFDATSTANYSNVAIPGCDIVIDYDTVELRDDQNPYNVIPCAGTVDGWVLIDSGLPYIVFNNETTYPDATEPWLISVPEGGSTLDYPQLDLSYIDNYDLDNAQYVLVDYGSTPPDAAYFAANGTNLFTDFDGTPYEDDEWPADSFYTGLDNGSYTIYILVTDDAGNSNILGLFDWSFTIDQTAPIAIVWDELIPCRTTPDANNSIDLKWANAGDVVQNHIWILSYGDAGTGYTHYPEYEDHSEPTISAPDPYGASPQNGWVKYSIAPPTAWPHPLTGMARGYYYVTIFAEDAAGLMSEAPADPFYRESISYWPGDVPAVITGTVTSDDINVLSLAWGKTSADAAWEATHRYCDVGPSTDFARRSRPMPDDLIDIEDLMMFAMNYANTDYLWYPRTFPEAEPVTIALHAQTTGDRLTLSLELGGNTGFVKGLDIPIAYGNGLHFLGFEAGAVWPESSLLLHTNSEGVVTLSGATLGADPIVEGNGVIATLSFAITGPNAGFALEHMVARTHDNREIEVVNNPAGNVDNDDLINVIPEANYLGKNYPNPFSGGTTIQYGLKEAGSVKLSVYNTRGQLIRTLVNESKGAGTFQVNWNGRDASGQKVSAGVYFFRLETSEGVQTAKGLMIK